MTNSLTCSENTPREFQLGRVSSFPFRGDFKFGPHLPFKSGFDAAVQHSCGFIVGHRAKLIAFPPELEQNLREFSSIPMVLQPEFSPHPAKVILANRGIIILSTSVLDQFQPLQHFFAANRTANRLAG